MARALWSGSLSFGLVNVPVKVYSATEDHDVSLHQVHNKDGGRIRYQRVCEIDGEVVYFNREPSNFFRFNDEAKNRRDELAFYSNEAAQTAHTAASAASDVAGTAKEQAGQVAGKTNGSLAGSTCAYATRWSDPVSSTTSIAT